MRANRFQSRIYRTCTEIDLHEVDHANKWLQANKPLPEIDPETILCNFDGHTIFSIFFEHIKMFDAVYDQVREMDLEQEYDLLGNRVENNFTRRLFKILSLPTEEL